MSDSPWSWLVSRKDELQAMTPAEAEAVFRAELAKLDAGLDADVSDELGERKVVVSANRDAALFDRVRELVAAAPAMPRWSFSALRPARGFEFEFHAGRNIDARALGFVPRQTDEGLVVRLLVPNPEFEGWADIAWQIVEAGIGEEAAARIAGLEVDARGAEDDHVLAIESLPKYVARHT